MTKTIEGTISYKIIIPEKGEWTIEYDSSIENDLASMAISQRVMEICMIKLKEEKTIFTGKRRKYVSDKLNKAIDARFGLMIICDWMFDIYQEYKEFLAKQEARNNKIEVPEELNTNPLAEKETFKENGSKDI